MYAGAGGDACSALRVARWLRYSPERLSSFFGISKIPGRVLGGVVGAFSEGRSATDTPLRRPKSAKDSPSRWHIS